MEDFEWTPGVRAFSCPRFRILRSAGILLQQETKQRLAGAGVERIVHHDHRRINEETVPEVLIPSGFCATMAVTWTFLSGTVGLSTRMIPDLRVCASFSLPEAYGDL
ncbi:MAG: hypothetical protein II779_02795 [Clostridia bacterium]|nr:hypothetical protein [Clostridia bacterium]